MHSDFNELLSAFNAHRVRYLVVGAYAVSVYAQPRATKDLDILIRRDLENAKATYAALAQFGAPLEGVSAAELIEGGSYYRMGREPFAVDILSEIAGIEFDAVWERRIEEVIDASTGLKANFISRSDLVASKLAAGRPQDLADVDAIRKAEQACKGIKPSS